MPSATPACASGPTPWGARPSTTGGVIAERHRLERDLHDGAQQQVVALKVKLGIARTIAQREGADEIADRVYYEPSAHGAEANLVIRRAGELPSTP